MSRIDSPTFVQLLAALMNNPEVVETLSRLGISLFDNNRQCFLTEGMWKEISDEKILKMKDSWASSPHPENREEDWGDSRNSQPEFRKTLPRMVVVLIMRTKVGAVTLLGAKFCSKNEDGSPWITICVRADSPPQIEAESNPVEQRMREVGVLASTIEVIISSLDLNDTVQRILEQAKLLVPYDQATVQVLHDGFLETLGGMGFC